MHAVMAGQAECVQVLLECGASPEGASELPPAEAPTPLEKAVECSSLETIELLLNSGADFSLYEKAPERIPDSCRLWFQTKMEVIIERRASICQCATTGDMEGLVRLIKQR